jgi:formylglycine-generating enzyme required for sulfatase activity
LKAPRQKPFSTLVKQCSGTIHVKADSFEVGGESERQVRMVTGFAIDRRRVLRSEYVACVAAQECPSIGADIAKDPAQLAVVSYNVAVAYCAWRGGDLPTEEQWEIGAREHTHNGYPWGSSWDARLRVGSRRLTISPDRWYGYSVACDHSDAASPLGLVDLVGDPEFVESLGAGSEIQLRGGPLLFDEGPQGFQIDKTHSGDAGPFAGFRCAYRDG